MYSLLQRFFQIIFHSGQPTLNGAADAAPANALGCRDLGLAHAEKIVLVHTPWAGAGSARHRGQTWFPAPQCTRPGSWAGGARRPQSRDRCPASTRHFCASAACSCRIDGLPSRGRRRSRPKLPVSHFRSYRGNTVSG